MTTRTRIVATEPLVAIVKFWIGDALARYPVLAQNPAGGSVTKRATSGSSTHKARQAPGSLVVTASFSATGDCIASSLLRHVPGPLAVRRSAQTIIELQTFG
jgi:hypothetical protein